MHLGLVNLGSVGRGDGDGIGVLVCWCRCVSLPLLLFLVVVVCSWQVPPRSAAIAPACHRGPPSSLAIHANRSALAALAASMSHEPSALPRSHFSSFCSSLFLRRRQTADGRRQSQTAGGCLVASGAAGWPMTPGLAIVNGRPCGTKAHVPPAVGREIDGSARPSCCLLLLVPQCPSVLVRGAWLPTQPRSPAVHCTSTLVIDVL
jgi:hypothetical protein